MNFEPIIIKMGYTKERLLDMLSILVVCTGNTCRSPMAEALLKQKAKETGLSDSVHITSAGLAAGGKFPASQGAHSVMRRRGLDLSKHRSHQLAQQDVEMADLILTMTRGHKQAILAFFPEVKDKVFTLPEFAGADNDVADPYGGDVRVYDACANQIVQLVDKIWEKIVALAGNKA
ncbi:MAG: low molecular weight protein arginine phosphatase [Negativicutes bacterium]